MNLSDSIKNLKNKIEDINSKVTNLIESSNLANAKAKDNETKVENVINTADNNLKNINEINNKIEALKPTQSLEYEGESKICNNTLASRTSDMLIKGKTYVNLGTGGLESAGEKENKINILSNNNKSEDDIDYKEYKKEILLPVEGGLKSLSNGVADTIEQRKDGVYLVQRVKKMPLYGSVNFNYPQEQNSTNTVLIYFANTHDAVPNTNNILCNALKSSDAVYDIWNSSFDKEGIVLNYKADLLIRINKSRLNTVDYDGIKKFINDNQLTVYYEFKTPIETKLNINNLDLEVYKDTTYVATDNAIQPTLKFKVPSNIGGVIQGNAQNINKLYKLSDEVVDKFNSIEDNFSRRYNFDDKKHSSIIDRKLAIKAVIDTFKKDGASITSIDYYEKNSVFIIRYNQGYYYSYIMTSYFNKAFILECSVYSTEMILWVEDESGELYIRGTIPITNDVIRIVNPFNTNKDKYKLYEGKYTIDENTKTCTLTVSIDCLSPASSSIDVGSLNALNLKIPSTPRTFDLKAEDDSTNIMRFYLGSSNCQIWLGTAGKRYTGTVTYTIK